MRVILSTTPCRVFAWYAPLTCMMWRHVTGATPTVLCTPGVSPAILEGIDEAGGEWYGVLPVRNFDRAGLAQASRLFAYTIPDLFHDYLLTSDVDMWPLAPDLFKPSGRDLDVITPDWMALPICYLGAQASTWRDIIGDHESIEHGATEMLAAVAPSNGFNADEEHVTRRVMAWLGVTTLPQVAAHPRVRWVNRPGTSPADRVYFENWPDPLPRGMRDAHLCSRLHRPTWAQLCSLFDYVGLPADKRAWAEDYNRRLPHYEGI